MGFKIKISITVTTKNEAKTIEKLISSLLTQTQKPNEIVIVDGGSTDGTIVEIKKFQKKHKNIKLFVQKGATISQGRNLAIQKSKNDIIAMTDAGCTLKKDWLENITSPFKDPSVDFVAGFYVMTGKSSFQKAARLFLGVMPQNFDQYKFLPSARSMAFKKKFWEKIGKFDERFTYAGEDTHFNYKILLAHPKIVRAKNAIVYWEVPKSFKSLIKKLFLYSVGDAEMLQITKTLNHHSIKIFSLYLRYLAIILIFPIAPVILIVYSIWSINKFRNIKKTWQTTLFIPIIQIASDFSVMAGFLYGLSKRNN